MNPMRVFIIVLSSYLAVFTLGGLVLLYAYAARDEIKVPDPIQIVE
jgi:hypothetical protein